MATVKNAKKWRKDNKKKHDDWEKEDAATRKVKDDELEAQAKEWAEEDA